jgi:Ubiquitin family
MKIQVKELKGNEVTIDNITEETTVAEIKKQIESKLGVPGETKTLASLSSLNDPFDILVLQQKLLYLGKILADQSQVKDYKIADNAKLMLTRAPPPDLKKLVYNHFSKYYDSKVSETLSNQFVENSKKLVTECSLDDLERIAEVLLRENP